MCIQKRIVPYSQAQRCIATLLLFSLLLQSCGYANLDLYNASPPSEPRVNEPRGHAKAKPNKTLGTSAKKKKSISPRKPPEAIKESSTGRDSATNTPPRPYEFIRRPSRKPPEAIKESSTGRDSATNTPPRPYEFIRRPLGKPPKAIKESSTGRDSATNAPPRPYEFIRRPPRKPPKAIKESSTGRDSATNALPLSHDFPNRLPQFYLAALRLHILLQKHPNIPKLLPNLIEIRINRRP